MDIIKNKDNLYIEFGLNKDLDKFIKKNVSKLRKKNINKKKLNKNILSIESITHKLRQIKSNYEKSSHFWRNHVAFSASRIFALFTSQ